MPKVGAFLCLAMFINVQLKSSDLGASGACLMIQSTPKGQPQKSAAAGSESVTDKVRNWRQQLTAFGAASDGSAFPLQSSFFSL